VYMFRHKKLAEHVRQLSVPLFNGEDDAEISCVRHLLPDYMESHSQETVLFIARATIVSDLTVSFHVEATSSLLDMEVFLLSTTMLSSNFQRL
jgi:hypothetical protein